MPTLFRKVQYPRSSSRHQERRLFLLPPSLFSMLDVRVSQLAKLHRSLPEQAKLSTPPILDDFSSAPAAISERPQSNQSPVQGVSVIMPSASNVQTVARGWIQNVDLMRRGGSGVKSAGYVPFTHLSRCFISCVLTLNRARSRLCRVAELQGRNLGSKARFGCSRCPTVLTYQVAAPPCNRRYEQVRIATVTYEPLNLASLASLRFSSSRSCPSSKF